MTTTPEVLAQSRSVLLIDYPGRAVPEAFARAGLETSAHEGPAHDEYYTYKFVHGEIVRSHVGVAPAHVDLVYTYRPVEELADIVAFARELGARAVWFTENDAEQARKIVEDAGLAFVDAPNVEEMLA